MKNLLQLQNLDLKIEALKARESEIPKQKEKFEIRKKRLAEELSQSEERVKALTIEQRECEVDIQQKEAQVKKYDVQLLSVKKNEEYQALLHEMDALKKQIALKEERGIGLLLEIDEAKAHLDEDKKRLATETQDIDAQCRRIDEELAATLADRKRLEELRAPLLKDIDRELLSRYTRIRNAKKTGAAIVPLRGESCSGCHMKVTAQHINEIMAGHKIHSCNHCGRLLYHADNFDSAPLV